MPQYKQKAKEQGVEGQGTPGVGGRDSTKVKKVTAEKKSSKEIHPPELLCDVEISERDDVCKILEAMMKARRGIFADEWTMSTCDNMFTFLTTNILAELLSENIFVTLEIQDLFQTLCDYREKLIECPGKCKNLENTHTSGELQRLYSTKMKFMIVQIIDEIYKDLFNMEAEEMFDDDEDEGESSRNQENASKELYKKFKM